MSFDVIDSAIQTAGLSAYTAALSPVAVFSNKLEATPQIKYGTIGVGVVPEMTAIAFNGDSETSTSNESLVSVSLSLHSFRDAHIADADFTKANAANVANFGANAAKAVAQKILVDAWGEITLAKYGAAIFTGIASTFDYSDLVDIATACDTAKVPATRSLVLKETYVGNLLKDANVSDASAYGENTAVKQGVISRLAGMDVYKSTIIPSNSENLVGFVASPEAMAIAIAPVLVQSPESYLEYNVVTDPESGIALTYTRWYSTKARKHFIAFEALSGKSVAIAAGLKRIVSA